MATSNQTKEIEDVRADIEALREDIGKLSKHLGDDMASQAARAAENVRARAGDMASAAGARVRAGADNVGQQIEDHPVASMAVAFGAGLLIGKMLNR